MPHVVRGSPRTASPRCSTSLATRELVLIGEASHGTHEFYRARAELTKALIVHKGFNVVAVEADWPDAYRVNRWVRHASDDPDADDALATSSGSRAGCGANATSSTSSTGCDDYNAGRTRAARAGFYGLDLYSLHASIEAVLTLPA